MMHLLNGIAYHSISIMNMLAPMYGRRRIAVVSTHELNSLLNNRDQRVVLVDVRESKEWEVSRIPGAITVEEFRSAPDSHRQSLVIAYCTVGGRSLLFAQSLARKGYDVRNYQGSMLDWCKNHLPLTAANGDETHRVHTYTRLFHVPDQYEQTT